MRICPITRSALADNGCNAAADKDHPEPARIMGRMGKAHRMMTIRSRSPFAPALIGYICCMILMQYCNKS